MAEISTVGRSDNYQGLMINVQTNHGFPWEIFLSSTVKDLSGYRRQVQDALIKRAQVACFLSEDWSGGYDDTLQKCHDRLRNANGYMGIFGFWYGSIPPNSEKSITHLEFEWAMDHWASHPYPPVAIFMPRPHSQAALELKALAQECIPADLEQQVKHKQQIQKFHQTIHNQWRTVKFFSDQRELREYAIVAVLMWRNVTPTAAATQQIEVARLHPFRKVTDIQLGALGRKKQTDAVEAILSEVVSYKEVPAIGLLIYGNENAGQREFLEHLRELKQFRRGRPTKIGRPPLSHYNLQTFIQWAGTMLGVSTTDKPLETPQDLAEIVSQELKNQSLYLILDRVNRVPGGVAAFQTQFWTPFFQHLKELRTLYHLQHRLIVVVLDYTTQCDNRLDLFCEWDPETETLDFSKLIKLPGLGDFSKRDVLLWLEQLEVPDQPDGRRVELAETILIDETGAPDGTPLHVFNRLCDEVLWPDGETR